MTLSELLPAARKLSAVDKLRLIRILAEELDAREVISPLEPHKVYYLATPYQVSGVGKTLMESMKSSDYRVCLGKVSWRAADSRPN